MYLNFIFFADEENEEENQNHPAAQLKIVWGSGNTRADGKVGLIQIDKMSFCRFHFTDVQYIIFFFIDSWGAEAMEKDLDRLNADLNSSPTSTERRTSPRIREFQEKRAAELEWHDSVHERLLQGNDEGLKVFIIPSKKPFFILFH
jgi:hypothetical protein